MPQYGSQIDTMGIPIKGLKAEQVTAFPGSPTEGLMVHRTDLKQYFAYLNGAWVRLDNEPVTAVNDATETVKGIVELATSAETVTGTDTVRATTPAGVKAAINALVAAAPGALDTLDELANALGDDPNFATTITTALAGKAPTVHGHALDSINMTGQLPINRGGTGAYYEEDVRTNFSLAKTQVLTLPALVAGTWSASQTHTLSVAGFPPFSVSVCRAASPYSEVIIDWEQVDATNIRFRSDVAFAAGALKALISTRA